MRGRLAEQNLREARERYQRPEAFFERFFVWNYCPLSFMLESGANQIPEKLTKEEREIIATAVIPRIKNREDGSGTAPTAAKGGATLP